MTRPSPEQIISEVIELYDELIIPFMRTERDMPSPTQPDAKESDAEHAYTLTIIAPTIAERLQLSLDINLIITYATVHDLVEAYAGDVSVRHPDYADKAAKEHAAYEHIAARFAVSAPWIATAIRAYESRQDDESRFVYATDKLMGALVRLADAGRTWAEYYPELDGSGYHAVVAKLRQKAALYPDLLPLFDSLHTHLDKQWPHYPGMSGRG